MRQTLSVKELTQTFKEKIKELQEEPEFQWEKKRIKYATDDEGNPSLKLAIGNVPLEYDLWEGLRNPALVGLHPAGLQQVWEFHANRTKRAVDESGRRTIFQVPSSFDVALKNFSRTVLVSVMLPFSFEIMKEYVQLTKEKKGGSSHLFARMYQDVNLMLDKATGRVAIDVAGNDNLVLAMDNETVKGLSGEAIPRTRQGISHGPCKGGNYPQKSIAALTGLVQFGISRGIFRDEIVNGKVKRFAGPIRSIILFDNEDLVTDGSKGIFYPTKAWREFLFELSDFTITSPEVNKYRFCSYIPIGDGGCGECITSCPSGALSNSVPGPDGSYPERILEQGHRFWNGRLQFDFGRCCERRGYMATLFPEWSCAQCITNCIVAGKRRVDSTQNFYEKMLQLTKKLESTSALT